jgi:putative FmdB family regulatory protein
MPLYEFRCESCGHEVETIMAFSDPLPTICEACGGPLKKLLSAPAIQFKGPGFYLTDYGRAGSSVSSGNKEPEASGGDAKASGESKPSGESKASGESKPSGDSKASGEAKTGATSGAPAGSGGDAKPAG